MNADRPNPNLVLQVRNLSKSFPGVHALADVRLEVERGRVHALVGENGAGKSTLMRILAGLEQPDAGEILLHGRPICFKNPHNALRHGLAMIHQELMPFRGLSVAENIFMGREPTLPFAGLVARASSLRGGHPALEQDGSRAGSPLRQAGCLPYYLACRLLRLSGWIDRRAMNREAARVLHRLGVLLQPTRKMRELSVAEMQTVEIAKALVHQAEVLIMDEPTSAISEREVAALFQIIRDLTKAGVAVIYISHKLDEIYRIADTVTVLRDGRHVATHPVGNLDENRLIALMVGRALNAACPKSSVQTGAVALSVRGLRKAGHFHEVNFDVRRGEILGLAGLMGAGRTELVSAIYGLAPADAGEIRVGEEPVRIASPRHAIRHGIAMVNEDRKEFGLVLKMSVKHNLTLANLRRCCRGWLIDHRAENAVADDRIRACSIKTTGRNQPVSHLSGGNQQKVALAKALLSEPDILILDEPTRGIDIGAKAEIYAAISQLARAGKAIIMVSSELPEILSLSDRILVMREGAITAELNPRQTTPAEILKFAMPN